MRAVSTSAVPLAAFGDLDGDLWGVVLGGERPRAAVARLTDADVELHTAELDLEDDDVWVVTGSGFDLRVELADSSSATAEDGRLEPCRVSGSLVVEDGRREFDLGGVRSPGLTVEGSDSVRLFAAWFPGGQEIAVLSARPRGAKGNDADEIEVVVRGEEHPLVVDPRLSTTYGQDGTPIRVGLELWLGEDEDGDLRPRRVAGSSTGSRVQGSGVGAYAFECVSRGEPGAGTYLLLQP